MGVAIVHSLFVRKIVALRLARDASLDGTFNHVATKVIGALPATCSEEHSRFFQTKSREFLKVPTLHWKRSE
jgi:hypothetical protein